MKVLVLTIGTRGDVQPHVALAQGLREVGHSTTVCTSPRYRSLVTETGLAFAPLSDDIVAFAEAAAGRGAIEDFGGLVSGLRGIKTVVELGLKSGQVQRDLVRDGCCPPEPILPLPETARTLRQVSLPSGGVAPSDREDAEEENTWRPRCRVCEEGLLIAIETLAAVPKSQAGPGTRAPP